MVRPAMSIAVVGADYPNAKGPARRFEIAMCKPGEPVELRREPRNPADSRAIGVYSERGIQLGYIPAEQAQWIGTKLDIITAVFQRPDRWGAVIRVTFDGSVPELPREVRRPAPSRGDWPPPEPMDYFADI